jgi:hypothetical protein
MRIGSHSQSTRDEHEFAITSWNHHDCFTLPRAYKNMTPREFCEQILEDETNKILPKRLDEIAAALGSKAKSPRGKKKADDADDPLSAIKSAREERNAQNETGKEPRAKKAKKTDTDSQLVDLYEDYRAYKVDALKDILRWNRQTLTGNKDLVLLKVVDGARHGRLARCALCGGRLKITESGDVACNGAFDESLKVRIECSFTSSREDAPRWQPW